MSGWFGGAKTQGTTPPTIYNGVQLTLSTYAIPYSLVYGQTRVAPFLLQYEDFVVTPHTSSSGGGKSGGSNSGQSSYTYSAAVLLGICEGPVTGAATVYIDKGQVPLTDPSVAMTFFPGFGGQAPWSYLTTNHPTRALGYDHTAYVANGSMQLGASAALPNLNVEVQALLPYGSGVLDSEPSAFIRDYLTEPNHGADFPFLGSLSQLQSYCVALGIFLSPQETTQRKATDFLNEILSICNSEVIWSNGLLTVVPYGDETVVGSLGTFTPNVTPLFSFTDDDYIVASKGDEPVQCERKAPESIYNTLRVEFLDRAHQYNTAIAEATIDMDIAAFGKRPMQSVTFHAITTATVARLVAHLILNRQFFIRNTYTFTVRADYCLLEPMDVVEINDSVLGLSHKLVRVTQVQHGALPQRHVTLTCEELPLGPGGAPTYNWELSQGYAANYATSPGDINAPLLFNGPPNMVAVQGGYELWMAVSGAAAAWGGCNVYASLDDLNYEFVGAVNGPAKYGTLVAPLPTSAVQLDTVNTLTVLLNNPNLVIPTSTHNNADDLRTLLWVDGEIMAYGTATLAGVGQYAITYLQRGLYGSAITSHLSGAPFARLDTGIFRLPFDPGFIGKSMYLKFPSFNSYLHNTESLAAATAYLKVLGSNSMGSVLPATGAVLIGRGITIVGDTIFKPASGASAWDSDCFSQEGYGAGSRVQWRAGNRGRFMIGLDPNPALDSTYSSINFAFYCESNAWGIYESGTAIIASGGSYTPNVDTFLITYDGVKVTYFVNGVQVRQVGYTATNLFMDSSFYDPGAMAVGVKFGPNALVAASNTVSAVHSGGTVVTYPLAGTTVHTDMVSATIAATGELIGVDAAVDFKVANTGGNVVNTCLVTIRRDGSDVGTLSFDAHAGYAAYGFGVWEGPVMLSIVDNPAAGSHTYTFHVVGTGGGTSGNPGITYTNPMIKVREYKR